VRLFFCVRVTEVDAKRFIIENSLGNDAKKTVDFVCVLKRAIDAPATPHVDKRGELFFEKTTIEAIKQFQSDRWVKVFFSISLRAIFLGDFSSIDIGERAAG
jgi:hypothetical protein